MVLTPRLRPIVVRIMVWVLKERLIFLYHPKACSYPYLRHGGSSFVFPMGGAAAMAIG